MSAKKKATGSPVDAELARLRAERDRFVAFAFSAADILFELTESGNVVLAAGAVSALLQRESEALAGAAFRDLVVPEDRAAVDHAMQAFAAGRRVEATEIRLIAPESGVITPPLHLLGYRLNDFDRHYFLAMRMATSSPEAATVTPHAATAPNLRAFADRAARRARSIRDDGGECRFSVVEIARMDDLRSRLDVGARDALQRNVTAFLRANAVAEDLAEDLGGNRYGLVHEASLDIDELGSRIEHYAQEADPDGIGVTVAATSLDLDIAAGDEDDSAAALAYVLGRISSQPVGALSVERIAKGLPVMMRSAGRQMRLVRRIVAEERYDLAFQPIVDLRTRETVHFEALARFDRGDVHLSPAAFIQFAEQTGLIVDFDLATCGRVVGLLNGLAGISSGCRIAVNLSGRSLDSDSFRERLLVLLRDNPAIASRLIFEVTESMALSEPLATNAFLQDLRRAGHTVCLDDFGTGAAAFEYLQMLEVDVVKIDGRYVREAARSTKAERLLKAMVTLCRNMGVTTVGEMVEEEADARRLTECGVDFAQGYLFGRPSLTIGRAGLAQDFQGGAVPRTEVRTAE